MPLLLEVEISFVYSQFPFPLYFVGKHWEFSLVLLRDFLEASPLHLPPLELMLLTPYRIKAYPLYPRLYCNSRSCLARVNHLPSLQVLKSRTQAWSQVA